MVRGAELVGTDAAGLTGDEFVDEQGVIGQAAGGGRSEVGWGGNHGRIEHEAATPQREAGARR